MDKNNWLNLAFFTLLAALICIKGRPGPVGPEGPAGFPGPKGDRGISCDCC